MNSQRPQSPQRNSFDEALQSAAASLRSKRGACPSGDDLARYLDQELSQTEKEAIGAHVTLCGECDAALFKVKTFFRKRETSEMNRASPTTWGLLKFLRSPWPAYALAFALLVPAYRQLMGPSKVPLPPAPAPVPQARAFVGAAARVLDFNTVRGDQSPLALEARPGVNTVALLFFLPVGPQTRLTAEFVHENGAVAADIGALSSYDGNGNFCVVVAMDGWAPGQYRLVVHPQPGTGLAGLPRTFPFLVR